ncbi:MAG TPA: RodZ domain-containing protein [Noviherbaspirillum sp.]|nr:RodZ domain-containing protein [Noviherbaspirillum sp.]
MSDQEVNGQAGDSMRGDQSLASPGARLASFREERGWTVEQVASQLNLAPRQIMAIENDDYKALPGMPITRGFIRAYAKLLKVDPAPLLATLGTEALPVSESIAPRQSLSTPFAETRLPSMMERTSLSSKWIVGFLLILLLGVAIWATQQGGDLAEISRSVQSRATGSPATQSGGATPQQQAASASNAEPATQLIPENSDIKNPAPEPGNIAGVPNPMTAEGSAAQAPAPSSAAPSVETKAATGNNTLVLKAREDSWIEIRRANGNGIVFSRIVKAGETESLEVTEPISIVIGNATGIDAILRGAAIELKPATKSNVARLNVK